MTKFQPIHPFIRLILAVMLWVGIAGVVCADTSSGQCVWTPEEQAAQETSEHPWRVLEVKPGQGETCIVCDTPIQAGNAVAIQHRGRVVHVNEKMLADWEENPSQHFRKVQAQSALFDEESIGINRMNFGWLGLGVYVLVGLIVGGICAYMALGRGLSGVVWFFAGLVFNAVALIVLMVWGSRGGVDLSLLPQGVPRGLVKIPKTYAPHACPSCGNMNHPSAVTCPGCSAGLEPRIESEYARV